MIQCHGGEFPYPHTKRRITYCKLDITPLSVFYKPDKSNYAFDHAVTHSCRNFDKIYEWAVDHAANVHIEG